MDTLDAMWEIKANANVRNVTVAMAIVQIATGFLIERAETHSYVWQCKKSAKRVEGLHGKENEA